ncbi:MAG: hypothetical protein ABI333_24045 [bacterium]
MDRPVTSGLASALALVLLLLAAPTAAQAVPVLEKDDHTLNLDGSLKAFIFGMDLPHHPPELLGTMGLSAGSPRGGMGMADIRLKLEGNHFEKYKWELHFRTQALISSFSGALGSISLAGGAAYPPRILPLGGVAPDGARFRWSHELDRVNVRLRFGKVDLIVGRQAISFGAGFVWKPADLVGTFSPTEVDSEYKPGVDAIRLNIALGDFTELALVVALGGPHCTSGSYPDGTSCHSYDVRLYAHGAKPLHYFDHSVALARFRTNVKNLDVGAIAGWVRGDVVFGAFLTGTVKRFRIRAEAVYTWDVEEDLNYAGQGNPTGADDHFARVVFGVDYTFKTKKALSILAEIHYNGYGTRHAHEYLERLSRPRVAEFGEIFNVGLLYAAFGINWEPHYKLPVALTIMGNLFDPSMFINANITYKVGDESILVLGAMIPIGRRPKTGDLFDSDPTNDILIRSEFGLYPYIYYLQWKMYF